MKHQLKFIYDFNRYDTCRFCGRAISVDAETTIHQVAAYGLNEDKPWNEVVHQACDSSMPTASSEVKDGYRRYACMVGSPTALLIKYDDGLSIGASVIDNSHYKFKLSVIRNSKCIFYKNQLMVDIPDAVAQQWFQ